MLQFGIETDVYGTIFWFFFKHLYFLGESQIFHLSLFEETCDTLQHELPCLGNLRKLVADKILLTFDRCVFSSYLDFKQ